MTLQEESLTPLERWNDDRLDDLARQVDQAMRMQAKMTEMEIQLVQVHAQASQCLGEIKAVRVAQVEAEEHRLEREEHQRKERKQDRKWAIGTLLFVVSLVIAALAVFLG